MTNPPIKDNQTCRLKEVRQEKGITLEMVQEATKIPLDALKSIEQGYSVHKLQKFYFRGFIKIYAKYLELDETQVLQEYGMLESVAPKTNALSAKENKSGGAVSPKVIAKEPSRPVISREMFNKRLGMIIRIIAIIFVVFFGFKWVASLMSKNKRTDKQVSVPQAIVPKVVKPHTRNSGKSNIKQEASAEANKDSANKAPTTTVAVQPPIVSEVKKEAPKVDSSNSTKSEKKSRVIELTVRATKNGWLQVKADGQVVFQSALKKGDSETWKADSEIELSGRNINLLEFELNGKMLGALGASDRGAKKVVFTKDGLSVKK